MKNNPITEDEIQQKEDAQFFNIIDKLCNHNMEQQNLIFHINEDNFINNFKHNILFLMKIKAFLF